MPEVFIESPRLPDCIAISMVGGPSWSTSRVYVANGFVKRNQQWSSPRWQYDFAYNNQTIDDFQEVSNFWKIVQGAAGFRMRDWLDYMVKRTEGVLVPLDTAGQTFQLYKRYKSGAFEFLRKIVKLDGLPVVYKAGVPVSSGMTIDLDTGIVEFDVPPVGDLDWRTATGGGFDVPVMFTMDDFNATISGKTGEGQIIVQWPAVNVIEIKDEDEDPL